MTTTPTLAPLRKTATVPQDPADAFRLFTDEIALWWPLVTHSVGRDRAAGLTLAAGVGGLIVETIEDGTTTTWGTVTAWEPPEVVAFTWHPGTPPEEATHVDVRFAPSADGTVVTLTHTRWENRPDGAARRAEYDPGWDLVLGRYVDEAG